ncbi:MAG: 8-amino-7-oxononanoate synthase [Betaproteobacteria bacterium]
MPERAVHGMDFNAALDALDHASLRRRRRVVSGHQGARLTVDGQQLLAFASNDYLGLAADPRIAEATAHAARRYGVGAGASHLISGHHEAHERLEHELARFTGLPAALLFSSGYMANTGIVPALVGRGDAVFSDALNHACLIDGARLSRATVHVYPHADTDALEAALAASRAPRKLVLSDAVFSMDGHLAPVARLAALCERHDALLRLDAAHGFGVLGPHGEGTLAHLGVRSPRILYLGTLGKAAGVAGAVVAGEAPAMAWLAQRARTYVFTTASPPLLAAAVSESLRIIAAEPWRRERLRNHARRLRDCAARLPWRLLPSDSAVQALLIGRADDTMTAMEALWSRGLWVPGIRPPTVPADTSRLRISLSAAHAPEDIEALCTALTAVAAERMAA